MVSNVTVPMNFGKTLLLSPTHNNLVLNTSEGGTVKANSAILSFNSPVIAHMTGTLHMTMIDMFEFTEEAAQLFVEAAYSGTVEELTRALFRDVNRMSVVFKVEWLSKKCVDFFRKEAESVTSASYADLLFLFEEAAHILEMHERRDLVGFAIKRIEVLQYKQQFIDQYLGNTERLSTKKLDLVIELAGSEVNCIVQTLTNQLTHQMRVQGPYIPVHALYLLDNSDLHLCKKSNRDLFDKLFSVLEECSRDLETMKWVFKLHKLCGYKEEKAISLRSIPIFNKIPNLYHNMDMNMSENQLIHWLSTSEDITNVLMAVEAVVTWNLYGSKTRDLPCTQTQLMLLIDKLAVVMNKRGWLKLPSSLNKVYMPCSGGQWGYCNINISSLCVSNQEKCGYVVVDCINTCNKPLSFLKGEGTLIFHFIPPGVTSCEQPGYCGFILKTVPGNGTLRTVELCTEREDYDNKSVHFHDNIRAENMHIFYAGPKVYSIPLSWLGWLHCGSDTSGEVRMWEGIRGGFKKLKILYKM